ncbi:MAG: hypothetical protein NWQ46_00330 [Spirosomaceae bacterium]|nr:hypothetical protein [Spirosomataceae bacterium]
MKRLAGFVILILVLLGCRKSEEENVITEDNEIAEEITVLGDIESQKFLTEVIGNQVFVRGFEFGTPIDSVLRNESLELFEDRPSHVGFMYERSTLESADILYLRDSQNKLIGVDIDVYLNSPESADALLATAKNHYNSLFEKSPKDSLTWLIKTGGYIQVSQVKKELDNGLEIKYRQ